jgi:hypothetical protein
MAKTQVKIGNRNRAGYAGRTRSYLTTRREPKSAVVPYNTAPTTAGAVAHITVIAQGDGLADRSGDKIFIERVQLAVNSLSTVTNNTRYVLVRDNFNLGTTPGVTDVLATAVVAAPYSSLNVIQQKRFRILCDFVISGSANGKAASTVRRTIQVNQPCYFSGAASTTKAVGSLYLLVVTDAASSSNHDVEMQIIYSDF